MVSVDSHWDESYDPHFLKEKEFSKTSLKQMFNGSFNYQILSYYPSGRIQTIKINNQNYTGRQMREKLQLAILRLLKKVIVMFLKQKAVVMVLVYLNMERKEWRRKVMIINKS